MGGGGCENGGGTGGAGRAEPWRREISWFFIVFHCFSMFFIVFSKNWISKDWKSIDGHPSLIFIDGHPSMIFIDGQSMNSLMVHH